MAWLLAVAHTTTSKLEEAISGIGSLSPAGSKQLAADVGYLSNILSAGLGLPQVWLYSVYSPFSPNSPYSLYTQCTHHTHYTHHTHHTYST